MFVKRFLFWSFVSFLVIGFSIHYRLVDLPYFIGRLPGDMVLYGKKAYIHAPVATSCLCGFLVTMVLSTFFWKKR